VQTAISWAVRLAALILAGGIAVAGIWLDWLACALGGAAVVVALLPYWSHLADALGEDAEQRWRDRYQGNMRANADAAQRGARELALEFQGQTERLALTFQGHAERLQQEVGGARALAAERAAELSEARRRLARPKPRRGVLPPNGQHQAPARSSPASGSS